MRGRGSAALLLALLTACAPPRPRSEAERTVTDAARGIRYVVPEGWKSFDGEIRSASGTLLSAKVWDLVGADPKFVAALPDSLFPQLLEWSKYFYIVEGKPTRKETTVDGLPATELTYPVRLRKQDPPSQVTYWIVRRETRLFVLRASYPPNGVAKDESAILGVVAGWRFLETPKLDPRPS